MGSEAHAAQETVPIEEHSSPLQFPASSTQHLAVLRGPGRGLASKV